MPITALTPINQCYVLANIPLDNTYRDTMDFADASAQSAYFISKAKYKFEDLTPIRLQNSIRLPIVADDLYLCNYIMFKNRNHGNKWFYAFITKIDYININMCEVFYEIDVMQTWQFVWELHQSYIEREHSASNNIDSSLTEDFFVGENILESPSEPSTLSGNIKIVLATATSYDSEYLGDIAYNGLPSGCKYQSFDFNVTGTQALKNVISDYAKNNKLDSIVSIFTAPVEFLNGVGDFIGRSIDITIPSTPTQLGSYVPRNKKLLTYPYNYLLMTNGGAQNNIYRYEYFANNPTFKIYYTTSTSATGLVCPVNYNKLNRDFTQTLTLGEYPQVSWSGDNYAQWQAQHQTSQAVSAISSAVSLGAGVVTENPAAIAGGAMGLVNSAITLDNAQRQANTVHGRTDNNTLVAMHEQKIKAYQCHVREDYARIIDDYFTTYGYSCRQVKLPNIKSRSLWNYIKTQNVCITGNIPFNDLAKIKSIFNNGVTFWHDDNVGAYGRSNEPRS